MTDLPKHFRDAAQGASLAGRHAASGSWAKSTLAGYSAGMSKFIEFKTKTSAGFNADEPVSDADIYDFIAWAGESAVEVTNGPRRPVGSTTIKKYLDGIRAWNIVRHTAIPTAHPAVVKTLLSASKRREEEKELVTIKNPIMIRQLFKLLDDTYQGSETERLTGTVGLVAFWGMARLGELLRTTVEDGAILRRHVEFGSKRGTPFVKLHLRKAKTAAPGEIQVIHLQQQTNVLDPVAAVKRWMARQPDQSPDGFLFATRERGEIRPLTKTRFVNAVEKIWGASSVGTWSGHSFRVGGASLRFNLGTSMEKIARQGRWSSLTYLRYLKAYSQEDVEDTEQFLLAIHDADWKRKTELEL